MSSAQLMLLLMPTADSQAFSIGLYVRNNQNNVANAKAERIAQTFKEMYEARQQSQKRGRPVGSKDKVKRKSGGGRPVGSKDKVKRKSHRCPSQN